MTVHLVKLVSEKPPQYSIDQIRKAITKWVEHRDEVLEAERVDVREEGGDDGQFNKPQHVQAVYRFSLDETRSTLLDEAENALQKHVSWYIVGYHACNHDEPSEERGRCQWNETREFGVVPDGVTV